MKMAAFWDLAPWILVEVYRRFIALIMEAASTSETSVNSYQTTRRNNPEDSLLQHKDVSPFTLILVLFATLFTSLW
jgi:hypothetical protein